jgi:hypothetical protein
VIVNERGEATVTMSSWFESLNRSFHYQLTSIGSPAPDLHIGSEIENGKFRIAGGRPGSKISWQVTGTRKDPWANAHKVPVEENKTEKEWGFYLHPKLFGQAEEKNILTVHQPRLLERR